MHDIPTPALVIDWEIVDRNIKRLAEYAAQHGIGVRPHTKTHKSVLIAQMQTQAGAVGLTVAKVGEAEVMADVHSDLLLAYPCVDAARCERVAELAHRTIPHVAIDSAHAAEALSTAAQRADSTIGILVDLDVGNGRTGVQTPLAARDLALHVETCPGLRLDGLMVYPGHIGKAIADQDAALAEVESTIAHTLKIWKRKKLAASIVSGGSTPTAFTSHLVPSLTEYRPGTYVYNDMNCVRGGFATLDDCAARIVCTVVSNAVPGQVIIDAGGKTLTYDKCGPAPDSGHGHVVEYSEAKITKLSEEHGQVDVTNCERAPEIGERVTIIPNHICPCVNLQDHIWIKVDETLKQMPVDARGMLV